MNSLRNDPNQQRSYDRLAIAIGHTTIASSADDAPSPQALTAGTQETPSGGLQSKTNNKQTTKNRLLSVEPNNGNR